VEVIPKTLATNCGVDVVRMVTDLRSKHAQKGNYFYGIDGNKKKICDMRDSDVWEPVAVKNQVLKTAIEASAMLLRIDDVVSGVKKKEKEQRQPMQPEEPQETFGDARDG
jgi:T-complex protein 1 subunit gamma